MNLSRRHLLLVLGTGCLFGLPSLLPGQRFAAANYSLIEDGLYMGGSVNRPPPRTTAVLNLCHSRDPYRCQVHVWDSIPDAAPAPSLDWLRDQVEFVHAQRRAGRTTYVHCSAGRSRSGMVVTAYL